MRFAGQPAARRGDEGETVDAYRRAAEDALAARELYPALEWCGAALSLRPLDDGLVALLERILRRTRAPLALLSPDRSEMFYGLYAVRAWALQKKGRSDEAFAHLFEVAAYAPDVPYLLWARRWAEAGSTWRKLTPLTVARGVVALVEAAGAGGQARPNLEAALTISDEARRRFPGDGALAAAHARLLRRLAGPRAAIAFLADAVPSTWHTHVEAAAGHRALDAHESARQELEAAAALRPDDASTWHDLGDARLFVGRAEEAAEAYARADRLAPGTRAASSLTYARALTHEASERDLTSGDAWARHLRADLEAHTRRLADPLDPVIAVVRALAERRPRGRVELSVTTARPLSPALTIAFRAAAPDAEIVLSPEVAWASSPGWTETRPPTPKVEAPPASLRSEIQRICSDGFAWSTWVERARALDHGIDALYAALVRPAPREEEDVPQALFAQQVVAALGLGGAPLPVASRLARLEPLLDGGDWAGAAAALGMAVVADETPELVAAKLRERVDAWSACGLEELPPAARAVAHVGSRLAAGEARRPFVGLRARIAFHLSG